MHSHPNQTFTMTNDWQPDQAKLKELLWFRFQLPQDLCDQILASQWYQQKLNEFRHHWQNIYDEYGDVKKHNEFGWLENFAKMLKQGYMASRQIHRKVQQGRLEEREDPQHKNAQELLSQTEGKTTQAPSSQLVDIPETVDTAQLERFIAFFKEYTNRQPLNSQLETWISQLSQMNPNQQREQIDYSISICKTVIYPPRQNMFQEQSTGQSNAQTASGNNSPKRQTNTERKKQLEHERHQLNLNFNGINIPSHLHRNALKVFLDERFHHERKAMTPTRLQALVDMLSSMTTDEQALSIRQAIAGNYKTIYPPKQSQNQYQNTKNYASARHAGEQAAAEIHQELQQSQEPTNKPNQSRSFLSYNPTDESS